LFIQSRVFHIVNTSQRPFLFLQLS